MMIRVVLSCIILWCSALISCASADELPEIRVGVLKYGTLNWELDLAEAKNYPEQYGFKLTRVALCKGPSSTCWWQPPVSADSIGPPREYQKELPEHLTSYLRAT